MNSLFKSSLFCMFGGVDSARLLTLVKFFITPLYCVHWTCFYNSCGGILQVWVFRNVCIFRWPLRLWCRCSVPLEPSVWDCSCDSLLWALLELCSNQPFSPSLSPSIQFEVFSVGIWGVSVNIRCWLPFLFLLPRPLWRSSSALYIHCPPHIHCPLRRRPLVSGLLCCSITELYPTLLNAQCSWSLLLKPFLSFWLPDAPSLLDSLGMVYRNILWIINAYS